jgi:hypothetical protein
MPRNKSISPIICLLSLSLCACSTKSSTENTGAASTSAKATPDVKPTAAPGGGSKESAEAAKAQALKILDAWVAAQNEGKLDAYVALYDAGSFRGVKRTSSGAESKLDFEAWKAERSRMFTKGTTVAADNRSAVTWVEKPGLGEGVVEVRFTQRWKNPSYADHGPKIMQFRVAGGNARIVYEELVQSSPGWDDSAPSVDLSKVKFVRPRPEGGDRSGVDACAYLGGIGMACLNAYLAEKDPVAKRYMRRLSDADARKAYDEFNKGNFLGVAHAEVSMGCADDGPCKEGDDGYACLTKAEILLQEKKASESKPAHARACKCGKERAELPIMGGFLACDGGTPVERGKNMTTAEAAEVRACGECDAATGPAACAKEIERLSKSDAELARYIETVHVPRCSRP